MFKPKAICFEKAIFDYELGQQLMGKLGTVLFFPFWQIGDGSFFSLL